MTSATRSAEYTGGQPAVLYLSFEVGTKEWKLTFARGVGSKLRARVMPARDLGRLEREVAQAKEWFGLAAPAVVHSCYEAGRDGFWLHRALVATGIHNINIVVDSASIEVSRRQRRAKSDRLDGAKLVHMLMRHHAGELRVWSVVRVPTVEQEDRRHLHRELRTLKQERTRLTNRIKGLLATHGVQVPVTPSWTSNDLAAELAAVRLWDGSALPPGVRGRLQRAWAQVELLTEQIRALERERQEAITHGEDVAAAQARQLLRLRALGLNGAGPLVAEFFSWRQFHKGKEVGAAAGLVPTPYQSSDDAYEQGISKAGNRHLRAVVIEMAWCWLRYQPASHLSRWYHARFAGAGTRARKIGIVALARKLLIALWRFLRDGVIPQGATLKPLPR